MGGGPEPRIGSGTTVAPSDFATSPDPSVEQLSTTIGRKPTGIRPRIQGCRRLVQVREDHVHDLATGLPVTNLHRR
jgi:hypothetical protein